MTPLLGALFVLIWSSAFTAARAVALDWPPLWALALRFLVTAPLLAAIVAWRGASWLPARGDRLRLGAMGLFGTAGYLAGAWVASASVPSGLVAVLSATAPLFVAAGERAVLGRRLPAAAWIGLGLGWIGVAILGSARSAGGWQAAESWGLLVALGGALSQAVGILAFAAAKGRIDPWTANLGQTVVSAGALFVLATMLEGGPPRAIAPGTAMALAYSILVVGIAGYALFFVMLRRLPPSTAAALQLLAPPLAALLGWVLLGERLGAAEVAGGLATLLGLAVLFRARRG